MNPQDFLSCCSTQTEESEVNNRHPENSSLIMQSLQSVFKECLWIYQMLSENRQRMQKIQIGSVNVKIKRSIGEFVLILLNQLYATLDNYKYINTQTYAQYVQHNQHNPDYVDYAVEIRKVKHQILESEVDWYIENITKDLEIIKNKHYPSFFKPVLEQDQREALHTRAVINHALEQLEAIAVNINMDNAIDYVKDKERYAWCLAGMVLLLPAEELDPFQENGIHQRWQKAQNNIHEKEHQ